MLAQGKVPLPTGRKAKKQHGGGGGGDRLVASEVIRMPHDLLPVNFQPELVEAALDDTAPRAVPNLDSFFTNTTPCVAVQRAGAPPKTTEAAGPNKSQGETFYRLQDLWDSYEEWSAYGAEVPLVMENGEAVLQYYVPFLSAMQLFARAAPPAPKPAPSFVRSISLDSEGDRSVGDILCESDASEEDSGCSSGSSSKASSEVSGSIGDSDSLESTSDDGDRPADTKSNSSKGKYKGRGGGKERTSGGSQQQRTGPKPLFEYYELAAPYTRAPLASKIAELATRCPALLSTCTSELDPASWVSVAWYPIYRIPTGRSLRDLHACFLTFHALVPPDQPESVLAAARQACPSPPPRGDAATSLVAARVAAAAAAAAAEGGEGGCMAALSPFGFAAYKMRAEVWASQDKTTAAPHEAMYNQARFFLSQRKLRHPDFEFFLQR